METLTHAVWRCFVIQQGQKSYLCQGACLTQWLLHGRMGALQLPSEDKGAGPA